MRIGQRAFQGVVPGAQRAIEGRQIGVEHLDSTGVVLRQRRPSLHDEQRCLAFGSSLREQQRAVVEVEREQADLAGNTRTARLPAESTGDHQMEDQEQLALRFHDNALAEPVEVDDGSPFHRRERRIDGAKKKRRGEPHAFDAVSDDTRAQRVEIQQDVGELGHLVIVIG
jgi:hypothetical protein